MDEAEQVVAATMGRTETLIKLYHEKTLLNNVLLVHAAALNGRFAITDMLVDMGLPQDFNEDFATYVTINAIKLSHYQLSYYQWRRWKNKKTHEYIV